MESVAKVLERAAKTNVDILHEVNSGECVKDCREIGLQVAIETLTRNNVKREHLKIPHQKTLFYGEILENLIYLLLLFLSVNRYTLHFS